MGHRDSAPAFQEYASDMLANRWFRSMSLAQRGLLYTLRLECWVSGSIPADPAVLARLLGFPADEIIGLSDSALMAFFLERGGELLSPDLDDYRAEQMRRKAAMVEGGRAGGKKTQSAKRPTSDPQPTIEAPLEGPLEAPERRGEERSGEEKERKDSVFSEGDSSKQESKPDPEWVQAYDDAEDPIAFEKRSRQERLARSTNQQTTTTKGTTR